MADLGGKRLIALCVLKILEEYSDEDHPLTSTQIIDYLNRDFGIQAVRNTIRSNLAELKSVYPNISTFEDNGKGAFLEKDQKFEDDEIRILIDSVLTSGYVPEKQAGDLVRKLSDMASSKLLIYLKSVYPVNEWNHQRTGSFFWNVQILQEAINERKQAQFTYNTVDLSGKLVPKPKRPQIVHPYAILTANGQYYLIASLGTQNKLLHYRIDLMTEAQKRERPAYPVTGIPGYENGLRIPVYAKEHSIMYGGKPVPVKLKMKCDSARFIRDAFGDKAFMVEIGDGFMEVNIVAAEGNIRFFAHQFGPGYCEVLSPAKLRQQVIEDLDRMRQVYRPE